MKDILYMNTDFFKGLDDNSNTNFISDNLNILIDSSCLFNRTKDSLCRIAHPLIEIITSGKATYIIDNNKYNVKRGTIIIYPPFSFWSLADKTEDFNSICVDINFTKCSKYAFLYKFRLIDDTDENMMQHISKCVDIFQYIILADPSNEEDIKSFIIILLNIASKTIFKSRYGINIDLQRKFEVYQNFIDKICCTDNLSVSVEDYASQLNISTSYLRHIVRNISGRPPKDIINEEIVHRIKIMLINDMSFKMALNKLNLPNYSYYLRLFKQITGMTTSEFIETIDKQKSKRIKQGIKPILDNSDYSKL